MASDNDDFDGAPPSLAVLQATLSRRSRPLDEEVLDEIYALLPTLPEPLASVAAGVEVARAEGDPTGVRKRLFELGIAVVRYSLSVALAWLADALGGERSSQKLARELQRAHRLTDGQWCALAREVSGELQSKCSAAASRFAFLRRKALAELVSARNEFVHEGGTGDEAPEQALAVLQDAEPVLSLSLRLVVSVDPPAYQERLGVPLRPGVWRKRRGEVPDYATPGGVYLVGTGSRWITASPWLPDQTAPGAAREPTAKLLLIDAPQAAGSAWRWLDAETGEHRECLPLDEALRRLIGDDSSAPVQPCEQPPLVGRRLTIEALQRAAQQARGGWPCVMVLTGPQGIGRSRMLQALREAAGGLGFAHVIDASCLQQRRGILRPLRRAASGLCGLERLSQALDRASSGGALAGPEGLDAAIEAVEETLIEISLAEPVLLLLDDAQWADDSTLSLLAMLTERATRKARGKLLVVVAIRDEPRAPAGLTSFIGQVERDVGPGATRLELRRLTEKISRQLLDGVAPLAEELRQSLVEGAAGVPFYLVQSLLAWADSGELSWREGVWHPARVQLVRQAVPGIAQMLRARLISYFEPGSEAEQVAARVLACVGLSDGWIGQLQLAEVMAALGMERPAESIIETLLEAGVLVHAERGYGFGQPIVRQALLEDFQRKPWLPATRRRLLDTLARSEDAAEDAAFLAEGYLDLGDVDAAVRWLGAAIDRSLGVGLFAQTVALAERLAQVARLPAERARAELTVVDALLRSGSADRARQRLAQVPAALLGSGSLGVQARVLSLEIAYALGDPDAQRAAPDLIAEADRLAPQDAHLAVEARLATAKTLRGGRGLGLVEEALARIAPEDASDRRYRAAQLKAELLHESKSIDHPDCRRAIAEALDEARRLGSAWALLDAENDWAIVELSAGHHKRAIRAMQRIAKEAQASRFGRLQRGALINLAVFQLRAGNVPAAVKAAKQAVAVAAEAADWRHLCQAQAVLARALHQLGNLPEARRASDEAITLAERISDPQLPVMLLHRAGLLEDLGAFDAALADARQAQAVAVAGDNQDSATRARLWLLTRSCKREVAGARTELRQLVAQLAPTAESLRGPTRALYEEALGLLAEPP